MDKHTAISPVEMLQHAAIRAFPNHPELQKLEMGDSYDKAWGILARLLSIDDMDLAEKLSHEFSLETAVDLEGADSSKLSLVPLNFCKANSLLPLRIEDGKLVIATANPFNTNVAERLRFIVNMPISWALAPPEAIDDALLSMINREASRHASMTNMALHNDNDNTPIVGTEVNSIIKLGRKLLTTAIHERASDLHIQPYLGAAIVRVRVDGELRRLTTLPEAVATTLIRHFKAQSGMDSSNNQIPQDGRMSNVSADGDIDIRISTLPASRGERLVLRFLKQDQVHRLSNSGFSLAELQTLRRMIARPSGLVVITGPTGSGKSSTLYGMLAELNKSSVNIITVENPVEYRLNGISQVEVNEKAGRGFAAALRSILRQDPDIILLGEIRDRETAEIATQAALTGHLVLSTVHTNDSLSTIPRLLGLGLQPSVLADSLVGIASQRLCRQLCPDCRTAVTEPLTTEEKWFREVTRHPPGNRPTGCAKCNYTGYKGRLPILDAIEITSAMREAIASGETRLSILDSLREGGLKSLAVAGSLRIVSGESTVSEMRARIGPGFWLELAQYYNSTITPDELDLYEQPLNSEQGVVLITEDNTLAQSMTAALQAEGYQVYVCMDAGEASTLFQKEEGIIFVIMDFRDDLDLPAALEQLQDAGRAMYWSRLPALVLLPPSLAEQETTFREHGMISPCLAKPADEKEVLSLILRSHAR